MEKHRRFLKLVPKSSTEWWQFEELNKSTEWPSNWGWSIPYFCFETLSCMKIYPWQKQLFQPSGVLWNYVQELTSRIRPLSLTRGFMPEAIFTQGIPRIHLFEGVANGHYFRERLRFSGVRGMGFPVSIYPRNKSVTGSGYLLSLPSGSGGRNAARA